MQLFWKRSDRLSLSFSLQVWSHRSKLSYWKKKAPLGLRARKVFPALSVFFKWCAERLIGFADGLTHGADVLRAHQGPRRSRSKTMSQNGCKALVVAAKTGDASPEIYLSNFWTGSSLQPKCSESSDVLLLKPHNPGLFCYIKTGLMCFRSLANPSQKPPTCICIPPLEEPLQSQKEQDNLSV